MQQPQQLCRQQTKAAAKAAGAAAAAAAAASAHLQAASAASTPHSTPASRPSSAAAPPLAFCRNGNPTGGGPLILELTRCQSCKKPGQASTKTFPNNAILTAKAKGRASAPKKKAAATFLMRAAYVRCAPIMQDSPPGAGGASGRAGVLISRAGTAAAKLPAAASATGLTRRGRAALP